MDKDEHFSEIAKIFLEGIRDMTEAELLILRLIPPERLPYCPICFDDVPTFKAENVSKDTERIR